MSSTHTSEHAPLRLGTRRSKLAMAQSGLVARAVTAATGRPVELVEITTYGDTSREHLSVIGGSGVFVSALREAVLERRVDFAVHSLKDLPTAPAEGLVLAAVPERADPCDVLVARDGHTLDKLGELAGRGGPVRVGTGAARRMAQLNAWIRANSADLEIVPIRGNVDTRIGYVYSGELDAVVLARAGLARLDRLTEASETIPAEILLPAPGQGALAIECAADDERLTAALAVLDDPFTRAAVTAERSLLAALEAGCSAPVGALADFPEPSHGRWASPPPHRGRAGGVIELRLRGVVGNVDGSSLVQMSTTGSVHPSGGEAAALGRSLAAEMLAQGAAGLMGERAR